MNKPLCPAAEVLQMASGSPKVNCYIARRIEEGAILFPPEDCVDYTKCNLWRNMKDREKA